MKAKTLMLLITIILCGCDNYEKKEHLRLKRDKLYETAVEVNGYIISIIEFDSCQYLVSGSGYSQMMAHKGNCKFCVERSKK